MIVLIQLFSIDVALRGLLILQGAADPSPPDASGGYPSSCSAGHCAPIWCAKRMRELALRLGVRKGDERTSAPILWAEVEATNCGGATPRVHMARCMAYASIAWARTTNINMILFQSVCEGNGCKSRRCHSACSYGSSASEERRSCLQRGKPLGSATGKALLIRGVRWYLDSSLNGA